MIYLILDEEIKVIFHSKKKSRFMFDSKKTREKKIGKKKYKEIKRERK